MVVKPDGTKWACQSCLKGHRVSGCAHTDRELILVPKKGRPVTQCQHCRAERKKRSAHVSCDCGEGEKPHHPKEKCIHLREAEDPAKAGFRGEPAVEKTSAYLNAVAEEQGCCCHHGGDCTCAILKREVDKDGSATPPYGPAVKPRLETTKSDGSVTVFQNGHHKPVHRKNHLAHESGMPYKMPMARAHTEMSVSAKARRSVDSLALDKTMLPKPSAFILQTSTTFNTERRMSKSEQPSPRIFSADKSCAALGDPKFAAIDFGSFAPVQTNQSIQFVASDAFNFGPLEPMSGVTDNSFDPWSAMPSADSTGMPDNNPFGVWPTNPNVSGMAQPALTAASSGTQSEIDEIPPAEDMHGFAMPSIQEDTGNFGLDSLAGPGSPRSNRRSLPANFFKAVPAESEWPFTFDSNMDDGSKISDGAQAFNLDDMWEGSNLLPVTDMPSRPVGSLSNPGRPASKSLGPASAPSDIVFQSLFPDIDIHGNYFDSPSGAQGFGASIEKRANSGDPASAPMDFGPMDEDLDFTSQPWSDGSMSIPNDEFTASYDLEQDFSNPDFSGNWVQ